MLPSMIIDVNQILPSASVRNLGVITDSNLSVGHRMNAISNLLITIYVESPILENIALLVLLEN